MSSETPAASGTPEPSNEIILAKWSDRFFAWLIDFIIVSVAVGAIFSAAAFPFWFDTNPDRWFRNTWDGPLHYGVTSLIFFAYWAYFESTRGQSIGKMALHIKTTDLAGKNADSGSVVLQSFGKSFLLPIDVILGWIFTNDKRQRIFNRASNTIVIKVKGNVDNSPENISYKKD
jgi:uncharacterized RDD family membrane protein YckC